MEWRIGRAVVLTVLNGPAENECRPATPKAVYTHSWPKAGRMLRTIWYRFQSEPPLKRARARGALAGHCWISSIVNAVIECFIVGWFRGCGVKCHRHAGWWEMVVCRCVCVCVCMYACTSVIQRVIIRLACILMLDSKNFVADALIVPSMEIRRILNASTRWWIFRHDMMTCHDLYKDLMRREYLFNILEFYIFFLINYFTNLSRLY